MMAECLNTIHWAEGPLNVEVPCKSDYTIVEDSDFDESPSTKAARNRRREAIGRRYLLGHVPLIQTASLKGPFGSKCGWIAPWGHIKACPKDREPKIITKNQHKAITTHKLMHTEFATFGSGNIATVSVDEDTIRYDADNEDDTFDDINDVKHNLYMESPADAIGDHIRFYHDKAHLCSADYGTSDNSENSLQRLVEHNDTKRRGVAGRALLQTERKRKRGAGWLKGENALKRSRYEALERSSPTPVAGTTRVGNIGVQNGPSLAKSDLEMTSEKHCLPVKPILNTGNSMGDVEARNDSTSFRVASRCQKEISLEEKEEGKRILWTQQKHNTAPTYEYSAEQQAFLAQSMEKQQLDPLGVSSSDLDAEVVRSLNSVLCMLPQRVGSNSSQAQGQDFEKVVHGDSAISGILDNDSINESHLVNKMALPEMTSPASEESFHYRKTKQKSQGQKISLQNHEEPGADDIDEEGGARDSESTGHDAQNLQPANNVARSSIHHIIPENENLGRISAEWRRKNHQRQLHRSNSPESILAALSELSEVYSPNPLCKEFGNDHARELAPENDSGFELNGDKSLQDDVARIDCRRTVVAQAIPITFQEEIGSQAPAFRRLSEESVPSISGDHVETSPNPSLSVQRQLRHSHNKPKDLLARMDGVDDVPPAIDFPSHRKLLSQQESPMVNNAPNDLPLNSQSSDVESTNQINLKGNAEAARSAEQRRRFESASIHTLPELESELVQEPAKSVQSPWIVARLESVSSPRISLDYRAHSSANNGNNNTTRRRLQNMPYDNEDSAVLSPRVDCLLSNDTDNKSGGGSLQPFRSDWENPGKSSNELSQSPSRFPSTQILVDAATMNPWNSAFKKPSRRKSDKRVSFGVLPFDDVDSAVRGASLEPSRPMGSPPPPAGTLRLTQLDDPFHHRLRATRDLEVTEESLTKFMNTPWDEIPPIQSRAKPSSSSPAVVAMADAFIAADQQSHFSKANNQKSSNDAIISPATAKLTGNLKQFRMLPASSPQEFNSSPLADASFSIAPSGRVTAVSIEPSGYDAEDNLHAVIEDMGSFLAGWDVESELKKVKGHKGEKRSSISGVRKREYLSGVSNR